MFALVPNTATSIANLRVKLNPAPPDGNHRSPRVATTAPQLDRTEPILQTTVEIVTLKTMGILRLDGPGVRVVRDVSRVGHRQLDTVVPARRRQLGLDKIPTTEEARQGEPLAFEIVPLDPEKRTSVLSATLSANSPTTPADGRPCPTSGQGRFDTTQGFFENRRVFLTR